MFLWPGTDFFPLFAGCLVSELGAEGEAQTSQEEQSKNYCTLMSKGARCGGLDI